MGLTPLTFTGVSSFSNDLQSILERAQSIAQLPVRQLQNKDADVLKQKTLFSSLSNAVSVFSSSLSSLGTLAQNRALSATSSDTTKVTASNTGATLATNYIINSITSAATIASERSLTGYADSAATPVSSTGSVKLKVGTDEYAISLTNNTLIELRDKINLLGAGVSASILTTGGGNYLSLSANGTGEKPLELIDDPGGANTALVTDTNPGSDAVFQLNGINIQQSGNVVNSVIPGVTFTIQAASADPVTITLATDRTQLSGTLQDFVTKFNAVRSQVNGQIGPAAGLLTGNNIITQLSNKLREVASYRTSSGDIRSLSDLGIEFDASGTASLNTGTFDNLSDAEIDDSFAFLGSATSGLAGFSRDFTQIGDPVSGLIKVEQDGLDRIDRSLRDKIGTLNDRITIAQNALAAKLHAADALLARLASQQTQISASLQALNFTIYGKNRD